MRESGLTLERSAGSAEEGSQLTIKLSLSNSAKRLLYIVICTIVGIVAAIVKII